jgi:peptidoglycan/xylan/chitin deacetylase (PgdA/CDA1 family)
MQIIKKLFSYGVPLWGIYHKMRALFPQEKKIIPLILHDIPERNEESLAELLLMAQSIYPIISPQDCQAVLKGEKKLEETQFLLTFDDGFYSNRVIAETVLKKLKIKAVFFVCSDFINLNKEDAQNFIYNQLKEKEDEINFKEDKIAMDWEDLKWLLREGHIIGSHTSSHRSLSTLNSDSDYITEIIDSGNYLEKQLNTPIAWFSFPFGKISSIGKKPLEIISKRYQFCFSGIRGTNTVQTHLMALNRQAINLGLSIGEKKAILLGMYTPLYFFKRRKLLKLVKN